MTNKEEYLGGINRKTYDLLFEDEKLPIIEEKTEKDKNRILREIATFTKLDEKSRKGKFFMKLYEIIFHMDFNKISYNKESRKYEYNSFDKVITFEKLSDKIEDKKIKKELLSSKREGECHTAALMLVDHFENPATILTGTLYGKNLLHSIIELQSKNNNYIVDYTLNLIMPKQYYMYLTQFKQIENIKDIDTLKDKKDGTEDFYTDIGFYIKPYLTFREELKKDLKKNKTMLNEVDDNKLDKRIEEIEKNREEFEKE